LPVAERPFACSRKPLALITIPFLRITDELIKETKEPELKEYIQERYRKPWLKRMSELPFE
jgi:hypothetical protein